MLLLALLACHHGDDTAETVADTAPWTYGLTASSAAYAPVRGYQPRRAIVHLHSTWSHDACDDDPLPDGEPNAPCLADLRAGLCADGIDAAFVTDHPSFAAQQDWDTIFLHEDGDDWVDVDGVHRANVIHCDDHDVTWMPGIEDELMPVALHRHAGTSADENDAIYNEYDGDAVKLDAAAGATVLTAHTEQRDLATMEALQDAGLAGTELFNLHAMFAPDIREQYLGLDPLSWMGDIEPFTSPDGTAEPDLLVLAVLQEQPPSIATWDALLARGPIVGTAGTDAHENVLPIDLRDGERGDSYRRMIRWFSNVLLTTGDSPEDDQSALAAGRSMAVFEILGTPEGFDFRLDEADGTTVEMGGEGTAGKLVVECPTLTADSPHGTDAPELAVTVYKDGASWQTSCGSWDVGPGVYRVKIEQTPYQLRPFLGDDPEPWLKPYPWIYTNAIRVR